MNRNAPALSNVDLLERFWRRRSFHDMNINELNALNGRVIIRLDEFTLVVTKTTELQRCEMPAEWVDATLVRKAGKYLLEIKTDTGHISVTGMDFRLLRNCDLAMLIPPIDT